MEQSAREALRLALHEDGAPDADGAGMQPAGVLALVFGNPGQEAVLLSRRGEALEEHPGEIAFPGGRHEADDGSLLETALREAKEEVGVEPADVEILGSLGRYTTVSDYMIDAFVGAVDHPYSFTLNHAEVESIIEVPFFDLMGKDCIRDDVRIKDGCELTVQPSFAHGGSLIYGATARMLERLVEVFEISQARKTS